MYRIQNKHSNSRERIMPFPDIIKNFTLLNKQKLNMLYGMMNKPE